MVKMSHWTFYNPWSSQRLFVLY